MRTNKFNRTAAEQDALMAEWLCYAWQVCRLAPGWDFDLNDVRRAYQWTRRLLSA